jgi:DNA-binding response OmpR family regulator
MSKRPILVVDDDPTILATVSDALDMEGFSVLTATNGAEALEVIDRESKGERPSLVLLDMRMPVLDGWGFMGALRERGLSLSVVVMTAAADARRWGREIGARGVLAKPFELDELIAAVQRFRVVVPCPPINPEGAG